MEEVTIKEALNNEMETKYYGLGFLIAIELFPHEQKSTEFCKKNLVHTDSTVSESLRRFRWM